MKKLAVYHRAHLKRSSTVFGTRGRGLSSVKVVLCLELIAEITMAVLHLRKDPSLSRQASTDLRPYSRVRFNNNLWLSLGGESINQENSCASTPQSKHPIVLHDFHGLQEV
jgi:hypothetical protein